MLLSELAYLALAPFLLEPTVNRIVYVVVGIAMFTTGRIVLRRNRVPHFHLFGIESILFYNEASLFEIMQLIIKRQERTRMERHLFGFRPPNLLKIYWCSVIS